MKYILWPPYAILACIFILTSRVFLMLWTLVWHFRVMSLREAFTNDEGDCFFDDWSWKEFFEILLICPSEEEVMNYK